VIRFSTLIKDSNLANLPSIFCFNV